MEETFTTIRDATGSVPALIDSTGVGDPVVERLQRLDDRSVEGFHFSATSKQQLMEGLAMAIQAGTVRFPEGPLVAELEAFDYAYTRTGVHYAAPEGLHDDCVVALALAWEAYRRRRTRPSYNLLFAGDCGTSEAEIEELERKLGIRQPGAAPRRDP